MSTDRYTRAAETIARRLGKTLVHVSPEGAETTIQGRIWERPIDPPLAHYENGAMSKRVAEITVPATLEVTPEAPANRQPSMFRDGGDVWVVKKPYRANTAIQTFLCQIVSRTSQKRAT